MLVRVATGGGARLVELQTTSSGEVRAHSIEHGAGRTRRRRLLATDAWSEARRAQIARFVGRIHWMHGGHGYAPSETELALRSLSRRLMGLRGPDDALELVGSGEGTAPLVRAVTLFVHLVAGAWDRVFSEIDAGAADGCPRWLAAGLAAIGGDVDALLAEAARKDACTDVELDACGAVSGSVFEIAGLFTPAIGAYRQAAEFLAGPERADLCLELAKLERARGRDEEAVTWARRAVLIRGDDDGLIRRASAELIRAGALDDAYLVLRERCAREPMDDGLALDLAELYLWAARTHEARALLERIDATDAVDSRVQRCAAILHALEDRLDEADATFARAAEQVPRDGTIATWRVELDLRLGRRDAAARRFEAARAVAQTPVHIVLGAAVHDPSKLESDRELLALLELLNEPSAPFLNGPDDATRAALALLWRFGGNRGEPTTVRTDDGGATRLGAARLRVPEGDATLAAREAAADTLKLIGRVPLPELERRFGELDARFETSPHPLCYWGELALWLGDYDRAIARFEAALSRREARWGYVGQAAARILRGEWEAADALIAACNRQFDPVAGATTQVYVGEALRRRKRPLDAIVELEEAVGAKPTRVAAWMNLALARWELGQHEEALAIHRRLEGRIPRLLWDAWRALGEQPRWPIPEQQVVEVYERALAMMRGNRSSHTITYFDADGVFRIARDAVALRTALAHRASFVATGIDARLAAGVDEGGA